MPKKRKIRVRDLTIEPTPTETGVWVVEHSEYGANCVNAGQYRRQMLDHFDTVAEALKEYPGAQPLNHSTKVFRPAMPDTPPQGFDPLDAGETWNEEEAVGGYDG